MPETFWQERVIGNNYRKMLAAAVLALLLLKGVSCSVT